jgi:hypothetical protein
MSVASDWHAMASDAMDPSWLAAFTNLDPHHQCCKLDPASFMVSVVRVQRADFDLAKYQPAGAKTSHVGAYLVVKTTMDPQPENNIDAHVLLLIGTPGLGNPYVEVSAIFRGPNATAMEASIDAFVARMSIAPDPVPSPT